MPGSVSISEAQGSPNVNPDVDFAICIIGATSVAPLAAGVVSPPYSSAASIAADFGIGDAVDAACQAVTVTQGNPSPPPVCIYRTAATTPGVRGAITTGAGFAGTAAISATSGATALGTFMPKGKCITAGTVGTTGITLQFSPDNGNSWLPQVALGTAKTIKMQFGTTDTGVQYDLTSGASLATGDSWTEAKTTPPMWGTSDLYSAGPPAAGAFAAIAASSQQFSLLVITEPVQTSDFATLTAGLNYGAAKGKKWTLIVRFRDPTSGESEASYISAFQTFAAANQDDRICVLAGSVLLTDAFRAFRYTRSYLPAFLARLQSCGVFPGKLGERIAQHPGYVARGPLEGCALVDSNGTLLGHDEALIGGIDGPIGSTGGGVAVYRIPNPDYVGVYVSQAPVLYGSTSTILTLMDRRVANALERVAAAIAWSEIQGADIWDSTTLALDDDIRDGIQAKIAKAINDRYANEFQNASDPNLVTLSPTVSVSGSQVTITGTLNVRFYGYTNTISLTFKASR